MMKGIPPTYARPGFQSVMVHPKNRCSSSVERRSLLHTPSWHQMLRHRWAPKFIQKNEVKSLTFTIFHNLRRGGEGLQQGWGHLWSPIYLLAHGRFYNACGPKETISIACSVVIASTSARNCRDRFRISVSISALNTDATRHMNARR